MGNKTIISIRKAGVTVCLFLLLGFSSRANTDNIWTFDPELQKIHELVLNLEVDQAYKALDKIKTNEFHKLYVLSICETVDILISEDEARFQKVETKFKERLKYLSSLTGSAETLFLQAELNLQRGFNFLNLGQEFNAVWAIRSAYNLTQECLKKYPDFVPIKKTSGVIEVMVGSVPDKYHFFMSLLGMKGSVVTGQKQLEQLRVSESSLSTEANLLYFTIKGLINQQIEEALRGFNSILKDSPDNRLALFLAVNMMMKNSQSEDALKLIHSLDANPGGIPIFYIDYIRGEIHLQKGDYPQAIAAYQKFITNYKSQNFKKDSYYKISLAFHLQGKPELAKANFEKAKVTGRDVVEPDHHADAQLKEGTLPNAKILKVRLYTDGGYYKDAKELFHSIVPTDLKSKKEEVEYFYRKARLAHKTNELSAAKIFYQQTIDMSGETQWYFAPNSALQLGYIAQASRDYPLAKKYFQMALTYKKHEYKNSIDGKAKSALEQLPV
ncbi:MAG TPA: tetratricopeptide repeat protein [Cyclobacteriaceae bacterium]|nr:tetratricopeptide repeat protein [Cyclobacteriaceae bacterium]